MKPPPPLIQTSLLEPPNPPPERTPVPDEKGQAAPTLDQMSYKGLEDYLGWKH